MPKTAKTKTNKQTTPETAPASAETLSEGSQTAFPSPPKKDKLRTWRTCEIEQDCAYGWTPENVQKFLDGWAPVKDYAYIHHTKDFKDDMSTPRDAHLHLMLRFHYPVPSSAILARCDAVGIPSGCIKEQQVQKMRNWSSALNYLTHRDEHKPWKHVYEPSDVISNFDWQLDAEAAHQKKILSTSDARAKEIVEAIDRGEIREYNIHTKLTAWEECQYSAQISKAFKRYIEIEKMKGEREMDVIFICGNSGVGKDTYAVELCKQRGLEYYRTSNNNDYPFDDYRGQPAIIWSDARDNVYTPNQLFALLDNHWKSAQKARYSDINLDCKLLIITSIKPLDEWYVKKFEQAHEDRKQLYRRIKLYFKMDEQYIFTYLYNQRTNEYDKLPQFLPNTFGHFEDYLDTPDKQLDYLKRMLGGMADNLQFMSNNINNPDYGDTMKFSAGEHDPRKHRGSEDT